MHVLSSSVSQAAGPNKRSAAHRPADAWPTILFYTGLDYLGPVQVAIGRRSEKRWVALFTCLTIRAVHLELAQDLSTDACIVCLRSFMSIRGVPIRIRYDNDTNFVGAQKELPNAMGSLNQDAIQCVLSSKGVEWMFNCPSNPEAGGCLLNEAANIVNPRPLTHVPVDTIESEPFTPNHFLL